MAVLRISKNIRKRKLAKNNKNKNAELFFHFVYNKIGDNMENPKIVFMGTPEFAVPILEMLIEEYTVSLVVTQPDKKVGRKQILSPSPIKECALKNNISLFQPVNIKEDYQKILEVKPDIIITCAYGQIIPKILLEYPKKGCINVHASLLPKYRGGSPIHKAIINGEEVTGITIMYMDEGMDTGDMIAKRKIKIEETDNVGSLHEKLSILGKDLLKEILPSILNGTNKREKQPESLKSYAFNIKREEEHLNFSQKGKEIINQIRGLNPWPTANFHIFKEEYKILEAYFKPKKTKTPSIVTEITKETIGITCQDGIIYITKLKPFGKKIMTTKEYLNGTKKEKWLGEKVE